MSREADFFIYLLEKYAEEKNISATDILNQWDERNLTKFIFEMYEIYHTERLENAFDDIDSLVTTGKPAW